MRNGRLILDAVGHCLDLADDNRAELVPEDAFNGFIEWFYGWGHEPLESLEPGYLLSLDEFRGGWTTEDLLRLFFVESDIDLVAMHTVNFLDLFRRGANPWEQSLEIKRAAPERVVLYAACDPLGDPTEQFERMAEHVEAGATAFKFYPVNGLMDHAGRPRMYSFAEEDVYPFIEHARSLGVRHIAVHKAVPLTPGSNAPDSPADVTVAAGLFQDMTFEVVHSGWAFLEDCAQQLHLNPNLYANLECTANTVVRMPRRFARAVGSLVAAAPDRVLFATGAPVGHPQPIIEAIERFVMPEDLLEEGLPKFTDEIKTGLLGGNMAALHGIDVDRLRAVVTEDEFAVLRREYEEDPEPWKYKRERVAASNGG